MTSTHFHNSLARGTAVAIVLSIFFTAFAAANRADAGVLNDVDFIDAVLPSGGGSLTKSLTSGADDGWVLFGANAGDMLSVQFSAAGGTFEGAVLFDVVDGMIQIGDLANIGTWFLMAGMNDLQIQHPAFNAMPPAGLSGYGFGPGAGATLSMTVMTAGQYVVGVTCADQPPQVCGFRSTFTVNVSGNTGTVAAPLPEPGPIALFGLTLAGLGVARWRRT